MNATKKTNPKDNDEQLALKIAAHDEQSRAAFFALYDKYQKLTNLFIRTRVPAKEADDLHQEVWMKAWQRASTFTGGKFRSWILTVANNRIVDFYRKRGRNKETVVDDLELETTADIETPLEEMIDQETRLIFAGCLEELDENSAIVVRRRIAGDSYREICQSIDVSENAAHKLLFNAKAQVRECVEAKTT